MKDIKKYMTILGLTTSLTATTLTGCGKNEIVQNKGKVSEFENFTLEDGEIKVEEDVTTKSESNIPVYELTKNVIDKYNGFLHENKSEEVFTEEELEDIADFQNILKIKTENLENQFVQIRKDYVLYRYNDKLVVLKSLEEMTTIDCLTGEEILVYDKSLLTPICKIGDFLEDFGIKSAGLDFTQYKIVPNTFDKYENSPLKLEAVERFGALVRVYDSKDIQEVYQKLKEMSFNDQTLLKYNSCLSKYNQSITEEELALISSEFNEMLAQEICLTKENKTAIYDKTVVNLIYSDSGSSIVIGKIDEINGQPVNPDFESIFNSIDINPVGYAVDRGLHPISEEMKNTLTKKYGEGIVEALQRYGIPIVAYDMDEICQRYNEYKQAKILGLK